MLCLIVKLSEGYIRFTHFLYIIFWFNYDALFVQKVLYLQPIIIVTLLKLFDLSIYSLKVVNSMDEVAWLILGWSRKKILNQYLGVP